MSNRDHYPNGAARAPRRRSFNLYALLGVVGVLGVLAFVLSVVSPDDDDMQQEFVQRSESRQCLVQNCRSLTSFRVTLFDPLYCALAARTAVSFRYSAIEHVRMLGATAGSRVFCSRTGDRSPPTRSSFHFLSV